MRRPSLRIKHLNDIALWVKRFTHDVQGGQPINLAYPA